MLITDLIYIYFSRDVIGLYQPGFSAAQILLLLGVTLVSMGLTVVVLLVILNFGDFGVDIF